MIGACTNTPAPSAGPELTAHNRALREQLLPIVTPLKHESWRDLLQEAGVLEEFADVPAGIQYGFDLGLGSYPLAQSFNPPNHYKLPEHETFILSKYKEEIDIGLLSPGYPLPFLEEILGPIRTAPLGVHERELGGKLRVVIDHSYPRNNPDNISVNGHADSDLFPCEWGTFSACFLLVARAPEGTEVATFDVKSAFRNIPVRPDQRRFLATQINGRIHLDPCCNFGFCCSPGIFGRVADAIMRIFRFKGVEDLLKWVDDFIFFRYGIRRDKDGKWEYKYTEKIIWDIAAELGWPWSPEKFVAFRQIFVYLGFEWDLRNKTVCLPAAKKAKYLAKLEPWVAGYPASKQEIETVIGTLNHVTLVVPEGSSHLPSLYRFRASFKDSSPPWTRHKVPNTMAEDLVWWRSVLDTPFCGTDVWEPTTPLADELYVDASTSWGIGLVFGGKWLAWELIPGWKADGRDIGWAEMVAVELAMRTLISNGYRSCHITLRSDNQGVVGSLKASRCRNSESNQILRKIVGLIQSHKVWITTTWIPTAENPADAPSRGSFGRREDILPNPPAIPFHLNPFVKHSVDHRDTRLIL